MFDAAPHLERAHFYQGSEGSLEAVPYMVIASLVTGNICDASKCQSPLGACWVLLCFAVNAPAGFHKSELPSTNCKE